MDVVAKSLEILGTFRSFTRRERGTQAMERQVRDVLDALDALRARHPRLTVVDIGPAVRLPELAVHLIQSTAHGLFRETLERRRREGDWYVPPPECLIALKFLAAVSPWRKREDRLQDVRDLMAVYVAHRNKLDEKLLSALGAQAYPGSEREFSDLLGKIDRGDPISL